MLSTPVPPGARRGQKPDRLRFSIEPEFEHRIVAVDMDHDVVETHADGCVDITCTVLVLPRGRARKKVVPVENDPVANERGVGEVPFGKVRTTRARRWKRLIGEIEPAAQFVEK